MFSYILENNFGPSNQIIVPAGYSIKADVRQKTPDDGQKGCPKHVE